jgi:hypothetical protein
MKNMEESELIERYIANDLTEEERMLFEIRLSADDNLRELFRIHQLVDQELGDEKQLKLLNDLNDITSKPYNKGLSRVAKGAVAVVCLLVSAWCVRYMLTPPGTQTPVPESVPQPAEPLLPAKRDSATIAPNSPIAALNSSDFRPNPSLDGLIGTAVRGNGSIEASFVKPVPNTRLLTQSGYARLSTEGFFRINDETAKQDDIRLLVFSNRDTDFSAGKSLLSMNPVIKKDSNDDFLFSASVSTRLKPGLYYIVLTEAGFNEPITVTSFLITQ